MDRLDVRRETARVRGRFGLMDESSEVTDTSIEAIRERQGTEPMDSEQFAETFGDLPMDDEG